MKRFKSILYVNETSVDQSSALERAISLALRNQADLTILDVASQAAEVAERKRVLSSMIKGFESGIQPDIVFLKGKTYLEAIRAVLKNGHDLLIKPAENPSWSSRLFGSDDLHLLRKCPCPVWLMKTPDKTSYTSVLAAVDFSILTSDSTAQELNRSILEFSSSLALADSADLHIVHAWEPPAEKTLFARGGITTENFDNLAQQEHLRHTRKLHHLTDELSAWIGKETYEYLKPSIHLPEGPAKKVLCQTAEKLKADIVVMGTVARTGIPGLIIGNTAEEVINELQCSVLAVKPPGFVSPVKPV